MPGREGSSESSEPRSEMTETSQEKYLGLLKTYDDLFGEIRKLESDPRASFDEKVRLKILALDGKRHEIHLQLLEAGMKHGKDSVAVTVDIVRARGSLEEYGLPEFLLMQEWDVVQDSSVDYRNYSFNTDEGERRPGDVADAIESQRVAAEEEADGHYMKHTSAIPAGSCMIIYDLSTTGVLGHHFEGPDWEEVADVEKAIFPADYAVRKARARSLAERVHGENFEDFDSAYFHSIMGHLLGVIIPKSRLEEVAGIIRDEPEKYRLGAQFYSDAEKAVVEAAKNEKREWLKRPKKVEEDDDDGAEEV